MTKTKRVEKEFTDAEIEEYVQAFRKGKQEPPHNDPNEEKFPRGEEELRHYIVTLQDEYAKSPTEELREELRVYKAHYSGWYNGFSVAFEFLMQEGDRIMRERPEEEEEPKTSTFNGGPFFNNEEEFEKLKKDLADDPDTPKGHWEETDEMKTYFFDKKKKEDETEND
jgi:hypothetical protein